MKMISLVDTLYELFKLNYVPYYGEKNFIRYLTKHNFNLAEACRALVYDSPIETGFSLNYFEFIATKGCGIRIEGNYRVTTCFLILLNLLELAELNYICLISNDNIVYKFGIIE